ncbi:MAG: hypothetical protein KA146_07090 [Leptospiraceae bacterium]|nr:hypothetical protein [Leptospiraceae bacterium]
MDRELSYGCFLSKSGLPEASISTNKSDAGYRIAYRCDKKDSWHVIYIGSENRSFKDCKDYSFGDNFNWTNVPELKVAASEMVGNKCGNFLFEELVTELKQNGGESAVTDLLIKTISFTANRHISMDNLQAWDDAYLRLSAQEKAKLIPTFRKAIMEESEILALEREMKRGAIVYLSAALLAAALLLFKELPNSACGKMYNETTCVYTVDDVSGQIKNIVTP